MQQIPSSEGMVCNIWDSDGGEYKNNSLMTYDDV
jgi:hypothetical protein